MSADLIPPVVTDADQQWAIAQMPSDWDTSFSWLDHVAEQVDRFELFFSDDCKTMAEWSGMWRRKWWPKAEPAILHPTAAPRVLAKPLPPTQAFPELRPPIVTDIDRQWAIDQKPETWDRDVIDRWAKTYPHLAAKIVHSEDYDEIVDDGAMLESGDWNLPHMPRPLSWAQHVDEQAEAFEAHFGSDRKTWAAWSSLWRRVWWPKADPSIRHPRSAPSVPCQMVRASEPAWHAVLGVLTPDERKLAERLGCMPFKASDPRVSVLGLSA